MEKKLFNELMQSITEMDGIRHGVRTPSRRTDVASERVKRIRALTKLSQAKFAKMLDVELATLQNWEQGRRNPTGPARALLKAIEKDPKHVLAALID
ncbi:NadS family protein [Dyella nitratireducens]|uniref:Transcriptional regulator n=2 Tax=Dyella nitratireducens TaxID=1849580 RepID=A0ABQ1G9S8_9GAMM|nr:NadS family protein [Dyella nitratireducens]GGA39537.1 transcriptional regulator [Dyella nitratireducens]GLQ40453.1 transcriptional regulator [Dyella nitratireducens]